MTLSSTTRIEQTLTELQTQVTALRVQHHRAGEGEVEDRAGATSECVQCVCAVSVCVCVCVYVCAVCVCERRGELILRFELSLVSRQKVVQNAANFYSLHCEVRST